MLIRTSRPHRAIAVASNHFSVMTVKTHLLTARFYCLNRPLSSLHEGYKIPGFAESESRKDSKSFLQSYSAPRLEASRTQ